MGGQAIPAWDFFLAPYLKKTFKENIADCIISYLIVDGKMEVSGDDDRVKKTIETAEEDFGEIELGNKELETSIPTIYKLARQKTIRDCDQAHESFVANMNTMHSRGK